MAADDCCRILTASNQNAKAAEQTAQVERKWTQDIRAFKNYIYRHLSSIFYALHAVRMGETEGGGQ